MVDFDNNSSPEVDQNIMIFRESLIEPRFIDNNDENRFILASSNH